MILDIIKKQITLNKFVFKDCSSWDLDLRTRRSDNDDMTTKNNTFAEGNITTDDEILKTNNVGDALRETSKEILDEFELRAETSTWKSHCTTGSHTLWVGGSSAVDKLEEIALQEEKIARTLDREETSTRHTDTSSTLEEGDRCSRSDFELNDCTTLERLRLTMMSRSV